MSFKNGQYILRKEKEEGGAPAKKKSAPVCGRRMVPPDMLEPRQVRGGPKSDLTAAA